MFAVLSEFRDYLVAAGLADSTIRIYDLRLRQALEWCEGEGVSLDRADAAALRALGEAQPKTHTRLRQMRSALQWYYEMIERSDAPLRAIRVPKKPHYRNRALSDDDARLLAKTARRWHPEGVATEFGLYMGLRVHEIATLRWDGFDRDYRWYRVLGKRMETYELPVHPILKEELRMIRRVNDYVFPGSRSREHVTDVTVWKWVRKVSDTAGVGLIQPHELRHTAITKFWQTTSDVYATQDFARHLRLETTRVYVRSDPHALADGVDRMSYE